MGESKNKCKYIFIGLLINFSDVSNKEKVE